MRILVKQMVCTTLLGLALFIGAGGVSAQEPQPADPALDLFFSANGLYNRKLYDLAAEQYRDFIKKHPGHAKTREAELGLGLSLFAKKDFAGAEPILGKLAGDASSPERDQTLLLHAQSLLQLEKLPEAALAFQRCGQHAKDAGVKNKAAMGHLDVLYRQKEWSAVATLCDQLIAANPKEPSLRIAYQAAQARYELKDPSRAMAVLAPWVSKKKPEALLHEAIFLHGRSAQAAGKMDVAAKSFARAATGIPGPYSADSLYLRANLLLKSDPRESISDLKRLRGVFKDYPRLPEAMMVLGRAQLGQNKAAAAVQTLKPLTLLPSVGANASFWLARALSVQEKHAEAEKVLFDAIKAHPQHAILGHLVFELGNARLAQSKWAEADQAFKQVVEQMADKSFARDALRQRAFCLHRLKKYAESLKQCDAWLTKPEAGAKAESISFLRAENLYLLIKPAEALAAYKSFTASFPESDDTAFAYYRQGQLLFDAQSWTACRMVLGEIAGEEKDPRFFGKHYLMGIAAWQDNDWSNAAGHLESYLKRHPESKQADQATFTLALALERTGEKERSIAQLKDFSRRFESSALVPHSLVELGRLYYQTGNLVNAENVLVACVDGYPKNPKAATASYYRGLIAADQNQYAPAAKHFAYVINHFPEHPLVPDAELQRGTVLVSAKAYEEALKVLSAVITRPESKHLNASQYLYGLCLSRIGEFAKAEPYLAQAARGTDLRYAPQALYERAWCLRKLDKKPEALKVYAELLAKYPEAPSGQRVQLEQAELMFQLDQQAAAIAGLEKLLGQSLDAGMTESVHYRLAWFSYETGAYDRAAELFQSVAGNATDANRRTTAAYQAGEAQLKRKDFAAALKNFVQVTKEDPAHPVFEQGLLRAGETQALTEQWSEAKQTFARFVKTFPKSELLPRARLGLGWTNENTKQYPAAIAEYRKITQSGKRDETAARAQFQIGECYFAEKKYADAIKAYIQVETSYAFPQWNSRALLEMAHCLEKLGRPEDAVARFNEVIEKYPESDAAKIAKPRKEDLERK